MCGLDWIVFTVQNQFSYINTHGPKPWLYVPNHLKTKQGIIEAGPMEAWTLDIDSNDSLIGSGTQQVLITKCFL